MKKIKNLIGLKSRGTCIAIGCFDGIHLGHYKILKTMVNFSNKLNLDPLVFSFEDNIKEKTLNKATPKLLENFQKENILSKIGVKYLYLVPSSKIINLSPNEFIDKILLKKLKVKHVFCGFNFRFGKNRYADIFDLKDLCAKKNIDVHIIEPIKEKNTIISSSCIRECIKNGNITSANRMLGRNFSIETCVSHGKKIASKLGFPTINQNFPKNFIIPKFGVYKSSTKINNQNYNSITNIGVCPTLKSNTIPHAETFILNFPHENLYGTNVQVELIDFIRPEKCFNSIDTLKAAILNDINKCKF